MKKPNLDYANLKAVYINCTLKKSPGESHTQTLMDVSAAIMMKQGIDVTNIRSIDHAIAQGVYPDMTEYGWDEDAWPELYKKVKAADILVLGGPIWLGDNSSEMKRVIERLYAQSGDLNKEGQYDFYGKAGGLARSSTCRGRG